MVDHAVASGIFLLQYATYWYWLMDVMKHKNIEIYRKLGGFGYSAKGVQQIVEACRAAAYHNIIINDEISKFRIEKDPLLFLGIL